LGGSRAGPTTKGRFVRGIVKEEIKGGLAVDIGVRAFLPGSLVDLRPCAEATWMRCVDKGAPDSAERHPRCTAKRGPETSVCRAKVGPGQRKTRRKRRRRSRPAPRKARTLKGVVGRTSPQVRRFHRPGTASDGLPCFTKEPTRPWGRRTSQTIPPSFSWGGTMVEVVGRKFSNPRQRERVSLGVQAEEAALDSSGRTVTDKYARNFPRARLSGPRWWKSHRYTAPSWSWKKEWKDSSTSVG
jgi:hypothetical protein